MSNLSVAQIMMDAQRMASRVKDLDALGSALLVEAESNNRLVESLRQFQDDIDSLNRISSNKSNCEVISRIQQQNANSSEILKENRELKVCLEDYEHAIELIMQKFREQAQNKLLVNRINFREAYNEKLWKIIRQQREKINEMTAVMQRAAAIDDDVVCRELETMARLRLENKTLRELLQISKFNGSAHYPIRLNEHLLQEKAVQTEVVDEFIDDLSLSGASIETGNNVSVINTSIELAAAVSTSSIMNSLKTNLTDAAPTQADSVLLRTSSDNNIEVNITPSTVSTNDLKKSDDINNSTKNNTPTGLAMQNSDYLASAAAKNSPT